MSIATDSEVSDFYPRPPRGGRRLWVTLCPWCHQFLSTPSARRATHGVFSFQYSADNFYPRPPRGGRPRADCRKPIPSTYFYPRPPRGGRLHKLVESGSGAGISIHALREEGDACCGYTVPRHPAFLSTPSARRATWACRCTSTVGRYFYPRPPRGGRQTSLRPVLPQGDFYPRPPRGGRLDVYFFPLVGVCISIHALREEGDVQMVTVANEILKFLSTPSARRATAGILKGIAGRAISIHALREEGDKMQPT